MFVPTLHPATHAGQQKQEEGPIVAARGYEGLFAQGGNKVERSIKPSRIACISVLSINIEISRSNRRPKSEDERLDEAYRRNQMSRQLDHEAAAAYASLLLRR